MMNDPGESSAVPLEYRSACEREIITTLLRTLPAPWKLLPSLDVPVPGLDFQYTPDLVIKNETTGQSMSVEVESSVSLSLPNIMKFRRIQAAIEQSGGDFLLVVHGETPGSGGARRWLGEYGVNAVGASKAVEVAGVIEKQLTIRGPDVAMKFPG
jgi:hypothetical protein